MLTASGRVDGAGGCPRIRAGVVSPASVHIDVKNATPNDHSSASPDCGGGLSASWRVYRAGDCPTICSRIVSPARVESLGPITATPDDHFTAGPDCRVKVSASRRVSRAGGYPTIRAGIVSPAGVQVVPGTVVGKSSPNDYFTASPYCRVIFSASRRVGGTGGCPTIRAGIVSPAGVQIGETMIVCAPQNDHFTAGPDCRVPVSGKRSISGGRSSPLVCARRITRVGNFRKSVDNLPQRCYHRHCTKRVGLRGSNLTSFPLRRQISDQTLC